MSQKLSPRTQVGKGFVFCQLETSQLMSQVVEISALVNNGNQKEATTRLNLMTNGLKRICADHQKIPDDHVLKKIFNAQKALEKRNKNATSVALAEAVFDLKHGDDFLHIPIL